MSHQTTVLAHRANCDGPDRVHENSIPAVRLALRHGWGLEIDIRRDADGGFYISHDPRPSAAGAGADAYCALFRAHPGARIALNVKELGYEADLIQYLDAQGVLPQMCLFDMEFLETIPGTTARTFRRLHPAVTVAARVSDRGEPVERALAIPEASVIWLDEFDRLWATAADIRRLTEAGRTVYAISPELHGFSLEAARARWADFIHWGVSGICTDHPRALEQWLAGCSVEATV